MAIETLDQLGIRQRQELSAAIERHQKHMGYLLQRHQMEMVEAMLRARGEDFFGLVLEKMRQPFKDCLEDEDPHSADSWDAKCVLNVINRLESKLQNS